MNISLTPELEQFIAKKISSGCYQSASEMVREGLRLLEERDETKTPPFSVSSMDELRAKVREGIEALDRGEYSEFKSLDALTHFFQDIKEEGEDRLKKTANRAA
jgi:antitoxin ParD1/3/4